MKKSLLLVVVIALLVWFLVPELIPAPPAAGWYPDPGVSVIFSIAGGLIAWGILNLLTRTSAQKPGLPVQGLAALIGALILLWTAGYFLTYNDGKVDAPITITCGPNGPAASPDKVTVAVGKHIIWNLSVKGGTQVSIHSFKRRSLLRPKAWETNESPVGEDELNNGNGQSTVTVEVRESARGRNYRYAVTCQAPGEGPTTLDPMIDVPPRK